MTKEEGYNWGMMCGAWMSSANLAVVTMQDPDRSWKQCQNEYTVYVRG